jgi:hypothetical protein
MALDQKTLLKLLALLVPQKGTSSLTKRAVSQGLLRNRSPEDLTQLIARRSTPFFGKKRDPNWKQSLYEGRRFDPNRSFEGTSGMIKGPSTRTREEMNDLLKNAPLSKATQSLEDYEELKRLRQILKELLS